MRYLAAAVCLLAVLPSSPTYGRIVASLPTGTAGSHPHHTELEMSANGHLLANGVHAGRASCRRCRSATTRIRTGSPST